MLTAIRSAFSKGFMRVILTALMGLLVLSFAIWGIGDTLRRSGDNNIATVGKQAISLQEFQAQYQRETRLLSKQMQRPITSAELTQMGMDRLVLNRQITDALLDAKVAELKLDIADIAVSNRITTAPIFKGGSGKFDVNRFQEMLRELGYSETDYFNLEKKLALRQHLAASIVGLNQAPIAVLSALNSYNTQKRVAEFVQITSAQAGNLSVPTDDQLKAFYEERKPFFRAPEYRSAVVVAATPTSLADSLNISEDDLKANYDKIKASLTTPEKRTFERIRFETAEKAAAASGKSFDELVKELNLTPEQIAFGTHEKAGMIDKVVADAGFSLQKGETSKPVASNFGTIILRATNIEASSTIPYLELRERLKQEMVRERSRNAVYDIQDKIDKERASGLPLADIVEKLKIKATKIAAIDNQGRDKNGVEVALEGGVLTLKDIFDAGVNIERDPIQLKDNGGSIWVEVSSITPSRDKTFEEVKAEATSRYMENQIAVKLKAIAGDILKAVEGGKSLKEASNLTPTMSVAKSRFEQDSVWGQRALETLFSTVKDKAATTSGNDAVEQIVFVTRDIIDIPYDAKSKEAVDMSGQLLKTYEDDLLMQYIASLRKSTKVTIDEAMFKRALGSKVEN